MLGQQAGDDSYMKGVVFSLSLPPLNFIPLVIPLLSPSVCPSVLSLPLQRLVSSSVVSSLIHLVFLPPCSPLSRFLPPPACHAPNLFCRDAFLLDTSFVLPPVILLTTLLFPIFHPVVVPACPLALLPCLHSGFPTLCSHPSFLLLTFSSSTPPSVHLCPRVLLTHLFLSPSFSFSASPLLLLLL